MKVFFIVLPAIALFAALASVGVLYAQEDGIKQIEPVLPPAKKENVPDGGGD